MVMMQPSIAGNRAMDDVFALLRVISDPMAATDVLEKIKAGQQALAQKADELREREAAIAGAERDIADERQKTGVELKLAEATRIELEEKLNGVADERNSLSSHLQQKTAEFDKREADLEARYTDLSLYEKKLVARARELDEADRELSDREAAIEGRKQALANAEAEHAQKRQRLMQAMG